MTKKQEAMVWGAIAGMSSVLTELVIVDPASLINNFDSATFFGYCIRVIGLMILGAVVVKINNETNIQKAFQLGVMAPALIIGIQTGANLKETDAELKDVKVQIQKIQQRGSTEGANEKNYLSDSLSIITSAYAQDDYPEVPKGEHRDVSFNTRFWYGLTGSEKQGWFVIAGSHKDLDSAEKQEDKLKTQGWIVKIGEPFAWGGYYSVLIGSYLSREKAIAIRDFAIKEGLPKDTYIWRR